MFAFVKLNVAEFKSNSLRRLQRPEHDIKGKYKTTNRNRKQLTECEKPEEQDKNGITSSMAYLYCNTQE
jgi:hypothetical protein